MGYQQTSGNAGQILKFVVNSIPEVVLGYQQTSGNAGQILKLVVKLLPEVVLGYQQTSGKLWPQENYGPGDENFKFI